MNAAPNHEPPTTDQRLTRLEVLMENLIERVARLEAEVCHRIAGGPTSGRLDGAGQAALIRRTVARRPAEHRAES